MNLLTVPAQAIEPHIAELAHSMQSLNTSVSFKCKIRLNLWDVEERKSSRPSARYRKSAGSATKKNRKAKDHFRHAKSLKTRLVEKVSLDMIVDQVFGPEEKSAIEDRGMPFPNRKLE